MTERQEYIATIGFMDRLGKGGSLKRSLGMASGVLTIPKPFGFEAATQSQADKV